MISNMKTKRRYGVRYPWSSWFKKDTITLRRGTHFDGEPHGMAQTARSWAARNGYKLSTSIQGDKLILTVVSRPAAA